MANRLLRAILIPPLVGVVAALIILGLVNFDLLVTVAAKLIVAIVIVGGFVLIAKRLFFAK